MKKEKTKFIKQNEEINLYPDPDMIFYLKRKGKSDQDIRSYEKLASFLKSTYSSTAYSFGYNFSESVI